MPSILDGLPKGRDEMREIVDKANVVMDRVRANPELDARGRSVLDHLKDGLSLADILGVTPRERDAVLATAARHIQSGSYKAAEDLLTGLIQLEPTDARAIYALGAALQGRGDFIAAGRTYMHFIAFDATDPEGYLRLGECFLGNGERDAAQSCFEVAKLHAAERGDPRDLIPYADRMLATLPAAA